jgi:hypothetical protein
MMSKWVRNAGTKLDASFVGSWSATSTLVFYCEERRIGCTAQVDSTSRYSVSVIFS